MTGKPPRTTIAHPIKRALRVIPAATDRLLSRARLESLLAWWRTTPRDGADQPYTCSHGAASRGACELCGRDKRGHYPDQP